MVNVHGDNFLVSGGAGFIGSHLVEELLKQNKGVTVLDDYSNGKPENLQDPPAGFDITKNEIPASNYSVIFGLACSKNTVCRNDPLLDLMTNAWGSFKVFKAAVSAGAKVVHASTGSVYGDCAKHIETNQYAPKSFYGVSKLAGEQYLRAFKEYYGLRFVGLRYFHVFGPRQDAGENGGVIAIFITKMLRGEPITVYGDGEQTRSFTYVKDVVAANFHAANSKGMEGDYYNVASGVRISLNELIATLSDIMKIKPTVEYMDARKGDIKDFNVSNSKLRAAGYANWTGFKDALTETVGWYRANSQA